MGNECEVRFSTWFAADAQRAFDAWIDPTKIEQWFGPVGYRAEVLEMDVRVSGQWRFKMISDSGEISHHTGHYVSVDPAEFLSFTWETEENTELTGGRETLVSIRFSPEGGGVRVTLLHEKLPNRDAVKALEFGWSSGLSKLKQVLQAGNVRSKEGL